MSWPLGAYVVRDGGAKWVPAVDVTRIAIAAIGLAQVTGWMRSARRRRRPSA